MAGFSCKWTYTRVAYIFIPIVSHKVNLGLGYSSMSFSGSLWLLIPSRGVVYFWRLGIYFLSKHSCLSLITNNFHLVTMNYSVNFQAPGPRLKLFSIFLFFVEQEWRSGESARLPPMCPGFDSRTRRHMWIEFVVGSRPCSEVFSPGSPVFLPPQKPIFLNFNWIRNSRATGLSVEELLCVTLVKQS